MTKSEQRGREGKINKKDKIKIEKAKKNERKQTNAQRTQVVWAQKHTSREDIEKEIEIQDRGE